MWKLIKDVRGVPSVVFIDSTVLGPIFKRSSKIVHEDNDFEVIWEKNFDTLFHVKPFNESCLLIQQVNGEGVSFLSKENGEIVTEVLGKLYLHSSYVFEQGCLIRSESKSYKLIRHNGEIEDSVLPKDKIFSFNSGPYFISYYLTTIACYHIENGSMQWSIDTNRLKYSSGKKIDVPFFLTAIRNVMVAVFTSHIAAFDVLTGEVLWELPKGASYLCIVDGEKLFLLAGFNELYVVNCLTGDILRETEIYIKNTKRNKSITYKNLMDDPFKSNFVQDENYLYFCLRTVQSIVTIDKRKLSVSDHYYMSTVTPADMYNYDIVLLNNKRLFVPFFLELTKENTLQVYERT
ncbi:outer membrane protein assembly factor BamB family protein [Chryseosolibacter indicus]|uniref:PQQ-binding-like beta-propeller repeat protein n=1 Tax=Chryseosolibacter indicus TaxID=2782351 RepID=A0ABS5VVF3_9BACT|nr:PQQ-binding-like beta-propeller repeat protein [Chryseosolibacter indicus]MBT1705420.1 PQQ-binding-like beta-propeller repeat protein [Chryseosolibacter indicus]